MLRRLGERDPATDRGGSPFALWHQSPQVEVLTAYRLIESASFKASRVERPQEVYRSTTPTERRVLNRAIFERIEVGPEAEITGTQLTPVNKALSAWTPDLGQPTGRQEASPG